MLKDTLKPKFHSVKHYRLIIEESGPLSHLSINFTIYNFQKKCLLHNYNQRAIKIVPASSQQISKFELGDGYCVQSISNDRYVQNVRGSLPVDFIEPCLDVSWINTSGVKFRVGSFVILDVNADDVLLFGDIVKIFENNKNVLFVCKEVHVECFHEGLHAYEVSVTDVVACCLIEDLISQQTPIYYFLSEGRNVISLKHAV